MTGYAPKAPNAKDYISWPADFGQRFTVCVDTEEEFDWQAPLSRDHRATASARAIPDAARRFQDLGSALTWLVDHPIATDPAAIDYVRAALEVEGGAVGTQLHPWVNPPFEPVDLPEHSFAGNLSRELEAAKLDALTDAITTAFDCRPILYRAGRYGLGGNSLELLAERGYRLDTSMRARFDYRAEQGPDYRAIGNAAFRTGPGGAIVELPFTTVYAGPSGRAGPALYQVAARIPYGPGLLARLGLVNRVSLTPEDIPLDAALAAVRTAVGQGHALISLAFHSPTLEPGHTPYVRDQADLARFWRWWDGVLGLLDKLGVRNATHDQLDVATRRD